MILVTLISNLFENRTSYESGNEWIRLFGEPISMIEEDDYRGGFVKFLE
ncbi:hypothetical protein [Chryseobacterium candidae]